MAVTEVFMGNSKQYADEFRITLDLREAGESCRHRVCG